MKWFEKKLVSPEKIGKKAEEIRALGKAIATLNGSFDLLHAGHLYILHEASKQADVLIVGLNSDASLQKYKSPNRPIIALPHRLEMMAALEFVDFVTWFDEIDPREWLKKVKPDVHVNGAEYGPACIEADVVKELGARLHLVQRISGLATSQIIEKIKVCG